MDNLLTKIEELRKEGAIVLLKWDGGRDNAVCTVMISRTDTDFVWRRDADTIEESLSLGIKAYQERHHG